MVVATDLERELLSGLAVSPSLYVEEYVVNVSIRPGKVDRAAALEIRDRHGAVP